MDLEKNIKNNSEKAFNKNNNIIKKLIDLTIQNNLIFDTVFPIEVENNLKKLNLENNKGNNSLECSLDNKGINSIENLKNYSKNLININKINNDTREKKILSINNKNKQFNCSILYQKNNSYNNNKQLSIENCDYIYLNKSISQKDISEDKIQNIKKINSKEKNYSNDNINKANNSKEQIKIKKNNKFVFMNKYLINKKKKRNDVTKKRLRKSIYRGVTKNGKKFQVIISYKKNSRYYGVYPTDEIAARAYDIISIKNKGIKASTNFKYDIHQIQKISEVNIDFNSKNISEKIINLIEEL